MKGQISAEMIVLLVVILALVALVATNLMKSAETLGGGIEEKMNKTAEAIAQSCTVDLECPSGKTCVNGRCQ